MGYYNLGNNEQNAINAADFINTKWGCPITCVNAKTQQPDENAQKVEKWAEPILCLDGNYRFKRIPAEKLQPLLLSGEISQDDINYFLATFVVSIDEFNPGWFETEEI